MRAPAPHIEGIRSFPRYRGSRFEPNRAASDLQTSPTANPVTIALQQPSAPRRTRMSIGVLAPRDRRATEGDLQQTLKRLGASESAPCLATCDCQIGLVCRGDVCTADW